VAYPDSPLNTLGGHHEDPKPGHRAPIRDNEPPVGSGTTPRFALFAAPEGMPASLQEKYGKLLEPGLREPFHGVSYGWFGPTAMSHSRPERVAGTP
jgi:hypothetical protein